MTVFICCHKANKAIIFHVSVQWDLTTILICAFGDVVIPDLVCVCRSCYHLKAVKMAVECSAFIVLPRKTVSGSLKSQSQVSSHWDQQDVDKHWFLVYCKASIYDINLANFVDRMRYTFRS